MPEPITLTDATLESALNDDKALLLLISNGEGVRSDFKVAFKQAAQQSNGLVFAQIDPTQNLKVAERFGVGHQPVLIGWYQGEKLVERNRPWGSDVPLAVELLQNAVKAQHPELEKAEETPVNPIDNKPITVTDATFQTEVIDYDKPVLVDFWAPWCGPCRMVAPALEKLAAEFAGQVRIAKVNVDENPGLQQAFQIMSIPTLMAIKGRTMVFNQAGALPEASLRELIRKLIALEIPKQPTPQPTTS